MLSAYELGTGDTIYVDEGTYNLSSNIILTSANNGLTLVGVPGGATILDRTNTATGSYDIDLQTVANVTIENLTFTGGIYGINATFNNGSTTNLTVEGSLFYGDGEAGINLANNFTTTTVVTGDLITNNTFHDMIGPNGTGGIESTGDDITVADNIAYNMGYGFEIANGANSTINGNTSYNNSYGIYAINSIVTGNIVYQNSIGIDASGTTITGNTAYNNTSIGIAFGGGTASGNIAYGNVHGIELSGDGTASDNLVYNNTTDGINGANGANILGNVVYGNGIGINLSSYSSGADGGPTIENNLIYNNISGGIHLSGGDRTPILNNTIYQTNGYALELDSTSTNDVEVRDNIFWVTNGLDISIASAAEQNVTIDFNDLYATGSGQIGQWNGVNYSTLATWQSASGMDADSISTDPLFVNAASGDFHVQSQYGSNHGGTLAPILNTTTGLPEANPGTLVDDANTGPTIDRGAPTDPYSNEPAPNGGYVNLGAYGNTSQASLSPAHYLLVINPGAGATIATGQPTTISWRDEVSNLAAGASDTDTIELLQGSNLVLSFSAPDTGKYVWTPPVTLSGGVYQIEIIRTDATAFCHERFI